MSICLSRDKRGATLLLSPPLVLGLLRPSSPPSIFLPSWIPEELKGKVGRASNASGRPPKRRILPSSSEHTHGESHSLHTHSEREKGKDLAESFPIGCIYYTSTTTEPASLYVFDDPSRAMEKSFSSLPSPLCLLYYILFLCLSKRDGTFLSQLLQQFPSAQSNKAKEICASLSLSLLPGVHAAVNPHRGPPPI